MQGADAGVEVAQLVCGHSGLLDQVCADAACLKLHGAALIGEADQHLALVKGGLGLYCSKRSEIVGDAFAFPVSVAGGLDGFGAADLVSRKGRR